MILMDIRVIDREGGYKYVTLEDIKKGDRFQFDFPDDPNDDNPLGSDWFVCSKDAYFDDETGSTVVEIDKPSDPRYPFSYLVKLAQENIDIERRGATGFGTNGYSGEWEALL